MRGRVLLAAGDTWAAARALGAAAAARPTDPAALCDYGTALLAAARAATAAGLDRRPAAAAAAAGLAERSFRRAVGLAPGWPTAWVGLGDAELFAATITTAAAPAASGSAPAGMAAAAAARSYAAAVALDPDGPDGAAAGVRCGRAWLRAGESAAAAAALRAVIRHHPRRVLAWPANATSADARARERHRGRRTATASIYRHSLLGRALCAALALRGRLYSSYAA
jgi:tetratricopeptide (TPR) repeat protein